MPEQGSQPEYRKEEKGMSGFFVPPWPVNKTLAGLLSFEGSLMRRWNLPMGVGFICRGHRGDASGIMEA